jgi:hypothetical protein
MSSAVNEDDGVCATSDVNRITGIERTPAIRASG